MIIVDSCPWCGVMRPIHPTTYEQRDWLRRWNRKIAPNSGRWDNVEMRDDEAIARRDEAEWRSWMNENRKTWKDIRIVKETTTAEVLQNKALPQSRASKTDLLSPHNTD